MPSIPLPQQKFAEVDDADHAYISTFRWKISKGRGGTMYACRHVRRDDGTRTTRAMHRDVVERMIGRLLSGIEHVDHIDGNGLNNTRSNLRNVTCSQNLRNCRKKFDGASSRYLGVCKSGTKWSSRIKVSYKQIWLGTFRTEVEAALAREWYVASHPELCARRNFEE